MTRTAVLIALLATAAALTPFAAATPAPLPCTSSCTLPMECATVTPADPTNATVSSCSMTVGGSLS